MDISCLGHSMPQDVLCHETFYATRHSMPRDILCRKTFYATRRSMPRDILCHETFYAMRHSMPRDVLCHETVYATRRSMPRDILCRETFYAPRRSMPRDILCHEKFYPTGHFLPLTMHCVKKSIIQFFLFHHNRILRSITNRMSPLWTQSGWLESGSFYSKSKWWNHTTLSCIHLLFYDLNNIGFRVYFCMISMIIFQKSCLSVHPSVCNILMTFV